MSKNPQTQVGSVAIIDLVIIIAYFVFCLAIGLWASLRTKKSSVSGYFLAGRDMLWFAVGASIFSSDIGSGAIVGFAGTGAHSGIAVASYELNGGILCVLALAWFFVPVYIASGVYTLPEYLKKRFGGQRIQLYMSLLSLILYVFTKISVDIYAGALFIQQTVGWNMYLGICVILVITAIYTVFGGLRAVIYTDTLQTAIMIIGSFVIMDKSFKEIGGLGNLYKLYPQSIPQSILNNSNCGIPPRDAFQILRHPTESDLPWPGNIFGITILGMWYFCSDQVLVQRSLAAKNMHHVKLGSVFAGYLKLTPLFTMIFPGMISRVLYPDEVACVDPVVCDLVCGNPAGCSNVAYPLLVLRLMPTGWRGVMLASMMAALMSSLTSVFNSTSTIFTMDIWRKIRPRASNAELLIVGKLFVLILVAVSVVWIPVLQLSQGGQLFYYIQSVTSYLAPPVLSVFVLAIGWKRTNEQGAFWGLMAGFIVGGIRMGLDFGYGSPGCEEEDFRPVVLSKVHFLHFTIILFLTSVAVTVIVSLCTAPLEDKELNRLTWWTRFGEDDIEATERELQDISNVPVSHGLGQNHITPDNVSEQNDDRSKWQQFVQFVFGLDSLNRSGDISVNEQRRLTSIKEDKEWRILLNINAIILVLIMLFLLGWFH